MAGLDDQVISHLAGCATGAALMSAADAGGTGLRSATCVKPIAEDLDVVSLNCGIRNYQMMFSASEIAFTQRPYPRCLQPPFSP
ncbi:hypothetical protein BQ8482_500021 [Mesorhizobium delmotii]|uniref:Uncharacterized protein n=1 Tax=Mesorhizobium delmotii TaxID=1631247 RepID=A0A2P9AUH1_9HYPH|nr:hypothetical protein BQ8482_500021 [Mesorhizobium delmotii]